MSTWPPRPWSWLPLASCPAPWGSSAASPPARRWCHGSQVENRIKMMDLLLMMYSPFLVSTGFLKNIFIRIFIKLNSTNCSINRSYLSYRRQLWIVFAWFLPIILQRLSTCERVLQSPGVHQTQCSHGFGGSHVLDTKSIIMWSEVRRRCLQLWWTCPL